jgi:predicted patatin/cPLA2 family phospholipase
MARNIVTAGVLDALIKARIATLPDCGEVEALGVAHCAEGVNGCNWTLPGYTGAAHQVERCRTQMRHYLEYLASQYDVAPGSVSLRER